MMPEMIRTIAQRARLACDACHRRKVKCNGEQKCQQCTHLGLECQYNRLSSGHSRSRSGAKRGHIVDSFKAGSQGPPPQLKPISPVSAVQAATPPPSWFEDKVSGFNFDIRFFEDLTQDYGSFVFPFNPIIPQEEFVQIIAEMHHKRRSCAAAYALAALTLNMRPHPGQSYESTRSQVMMLITRALELRGPIMPYEKVTIRTAMVSAAASICLLAHHADHNIAVFYLREAITCVEILANIEDRQAEHSSPDSKLQCQRLYWLLFVHERFAMISLLRKPHLQDQTATLLDLEHDECLPSGVHHWFVSIIRLFSILDTTFADNWINKNSSSEIDFAWLQDKQAHLSAVLDSTQQHIRSLTDMQQVDLIATDLWLRTLLWRLALSKFLLTANTPADSMSIFFPLHLSRRLQSLLLNLPRNAFEVHGVGMLEKIFDVTNTFADILIHVPTSADHLDVVDHVSEFVFLRGYLCGMSRFGAAERKILEEQSGALYQSLAQQQTTFSSDLLQQLAFPDK